MDKVTRQCPQTTNLLEEKGEPKRYRTEVLPLTSLTAYRWAKPAHASVVSELTAVIPATCVWLGRLRADDTRVFITLQISCISQQRKMEQQ